MLNHAGTQPIETCRLTLRRYEMTDADDMYRNWVTDPEVSRFWGWEPHKDIEETRSLLLGWMDEYAELKTYHWIIIHKSMAQAVGYIYFNEIDQTRSSVAVHFALSRKVWNQGIMTEACKAVLAFAFSVLDAERAHSRHHIDNPASGRVLRKCGMRHVKSEYMHVADCERICGEYCFYEITASDWARIAD